MGWGKGIGDIKCLERDCNHNAHISLRTPLHTPLHTHTLLHRADTAVPVQS